MTAERWDRIEALFEAASSAPPSERRALLDTSCAGDEALRQEVEALLDADTEADAYLERLGAEVLAPALDGALDDAEALIGERVGPYRVMGRLGRGGMGTVYRAERADGAFQQAVALKVVRHGLGPEGTVRFLAERAILARLQHPSIARLYDGGLTADGRPWLAMELVDGEPITAYARRQELPLRDRLALFARACDAVAYAHRNLIVHRDLKPSNLFVTGGGVAGEPAVKLLDFGIAKLVEDGGEAEEPITRAAGPMTPEYAAPEQILGEPITAATDVYALGVVLYELLAGCRPYRPEAPSRHAVERAVLEQEPPRPSLAALLADSPRTVSSDLDAITLKALCKEPDRRYGSVDALAGDVRRHLNGLPVSAHADSLRYRAGKFMVRHQQGVLTGALVLATLLAALGVTLWQAHRAEAEASRARSEAAKAEQILEFVTGLFTAANPNTLPGEYVTAYTAQDVSARAVLSRGLAQAEALSEQPAVQANLLDVIAQTLLGVGAVEEASAAAEQALALRRGLIAAGDPSATQADLAASLYTHGVALFHQGDVEAAIGVLDEALATWRALPSPPPIHLGRALLTQGAALATLAQNEEAGLRYEEAQVLFAEAGAPDFQVETNYLLGALRRHQGRIAEASRALETGLLVARALPQPEPLQEASLAGYLGIIRLEQGRLGEAEGLLRQSLAVVQARLPAGHWSVLRYRVHLGAVLVQQGLYAEALTHLRGPYAWRLENLGQGHIATAEAGAWLGGAEAGAGDFLEGERLMREALETFISYRGPSDRYVVQIHAGLAELYRLWGRPKAAEPHLAAIRAAGGGLQEPVTAPRLP